jgi:hypothetical protein
MNLDQMWNTITPEHYIFSDIDMIIYDVHSCVRKCQPQDQILLDIIVG